MRRRFDRFELGAGAALIASLALSGCYTQLQHARPAAEATGPREEAGAPADDPHAGLEAEPLAAIELLVDRFSYWITDDRAAQVEVTIQNVGSVPAILEGEGPNIVIYLEENFAGSWELAEIYGRPRRSDARLLRERPLFADPAIPSPSIAPREWAVRAIAVPKPGRYRLGVNVLGLVREEDIYVLSPEFDVWR